MITIHHNFDETKFKWLWARYVKSGNITKHCVNCIPGTYSKKFSGTSNRDLLSQPVLTMDEVPAGSYEAIYFCGVLKKGYLHKDPTKNNYRHNVHFAVRPIDGAHDVWNFENWHIEIDGGVLEHIPEAFELKDKFFKAPYTSHFYTCRIFRWMVGHFYQTELEDVLRGYPEKVINGEGREIDMRKTAIRYIQLAKDYVNDFMLEEERLIPKLKTEFLERCWRIIKEDIEKSYGVELAGCDSPAKIKARVMRDNLITRKELTDEINESLIGLTGGHCIIPAEYKDARLLEPDMRSFFALGIEEALDMYFPYQERRIIEFNK